jgi:hypothetical protein
MNNVNEVNGLVNGQEYHSNFTSKITKIVPWNTKGLKVTRLRLLSDVGLPFWDVSYCHGILNGEPVEVQLPFDQLPKRNKLNAIVNYAKKDGVYAKGLGILNPLIISTLC